jgi:hypothetical protein
MRLHSQPYHDVTIAVNSENIDEGRVESGATLVFTKNNWAETQYSVVRGVDDGGDTDGPQSYNIFFGPTQSDDQA